VIAALAHNLGRWVTQIALPGGNTVSCKRALTLINERFPRIT